MRSTRSAVLARAAIVSAITVLGIGYWLLSIGTEPSDDRSGVVDPKDPEPLADADDAPGPSKPAIAQEDPPSEEEPERPPTPEEPIEVAAYEGRVLDAESLLPIPGAYFQSEGGEELRYPVDAEGYFTVAEFPNSFRSVSGHIAADGYTTLPCRIEAPRGSVREIFKLWKGRSVEVLVVDENRSPVEDVEVRLSWTTKRGLYVKLESVDGKTGPDGRCRLSVPATLKQFEARVDADGFATFQDKVEQMGGDTLEILLHRLATATARVVSSGQEPVSGARVEIWRVTAQEKKVPFRYLYRNADQRVVSDADGSVRLELTGSQTLAVRIDTKGDFATFGPSYLDPWDPGTPVTFVLHEPAVLRARVVDDRGMPTSAVHIELAPPMKEEGWGPVRGYSNLQGELLFPSLRRGVYKVNPEQKVLSAPKTVHTDEGEFTIVVPFEGSYSASVRVVRETDKQPVDCENVVLHNVDRDSIHFNFEDHGSAYRFTNVPRGAYVAKVSPKLEAPRYSDRFVLDDEHPNAEITLEVREGSKVDGVLVSPVGAPIADATIELHQLRGLEEKFALHTLLLATTTDADGRFAFPNAPLEFGLYLKRRTRSAWLWGPVSLDSHRTDVRIVGTKKQGGSK